MQEEVKHQVYRSSCKIQEFGGQGITIHPRPDERHITRKDVYDLKPLVTTEFNIEGNPHQSLLIWYWM
jgi:pyridoxine 5-phosphate synthase